MFCRIYRSHPLTRVIEGLYIFLGTFLIGFSAVQATEWVKAQLTADEHLDNIVTGPRKLDSCQNRDGISLIKHWSDDEFSEPKNELFVAISNEGNEAFYYYESDVQVIDFPDRAIYPQLNYAEIPREFHLLPRSTHMIRVPLLHGNNSFRVSFTYRLPDTGESRSITAEFDGKTISALDCY